MKPKIVTIGVYGFDEDSFFEVLRKAKVDTFCDIRSRRGVRGSTYAFANSLRLQTRLAELSIRYLYRKDLAPTKAVRDRQAAADKATKTDQTQTRSIRVKHLLRMYCAECLATFDPHSLLADLAEDAQVVALFCVEKDPEACHRSLVADKLSKRTETGR